MKYDQSSKLNTLITKKRSESKYHMLLLFWCFVIADPAIIYILASGIIPGFPMIAFIVVAVMAVHLFLFIQYKKTKCNETVTTKKLAILNSIIEVYDNVNLLDFVDNTETSLRSKEYKKHDLDMGIQTHTLMNQKIKRNVVPDQLDAFLTFTNINTLGERLAHKKIISGDFLNAESGWFRAQYITVEATPDGIPDVVIYVTRNISEEKQREEHLIKLTMTDELTGLYNRRSYEEALNELRSCVIDDKKPVLFSIDVNGLKLVNDTKGHAAGDELIMGAADCLTLSFKDIGKVYRTGGDEFMAIAYTDVPETIRQELKSRSDKWHGNYCDSITMSVGYAANKDYPDASIDALERIADKKMYTEKEKFYKENGIDRRKTIL